ncbi:alpha/beta hydrolase [Cryptosporangium phraense]|uniref:Alpha/beta hydrolase n=1 Tax=Cryptosporangium phraense TaxID=2593070 RepID=A0A545AG95_9ACTN|nr:alpha/beta hydrolase [Cryptosporangium phraense]TQS40353.1 alpha/beta hydrolase [Cryptosporangium phraense]
MDTNRELWQERAAGDASRQWESLTTEPAGLETALTMRPPDAPDDLTLMAIHGGGFVSGSIETHRRMFGHLALAAGLTTVVVEYGLVPEHVFPSQLDQVTEAFRRLPGRVAIVGDSCGATLALGVALRERDAGPAALMLMSPWVDFTFSGPGYDAGTDPFFSREVVRGLAAAYLAGADYPAEVDPGRADLRRLPPTYVQVGADEALVDDARLLTGRLREAGVDVMLDEFAGQLHTFQMGAGNSAVADDAIGKAGAWLRSTLR